MFEHVVSIELDTRSARGLARIGADHPSLRDHFPNVPLVPATLQLELCAQIAGPLAERACRDERLALLAMVRRASFPAPCALPAELAIAAELSELAEAGDTAFARATCMRDGVVTCKAELVFALRVPEPEWADAIAAARARVAAWIRA